MILFFRIARNATDYSNLVGKATVKVKEHYRTDKKTGKYVKVPAYEYFSARTKKVTESAPKQKKHVRMNEQQLSQHMQNLEKEYEMHHAEHEKARKEHTARKKVSIAGKEKKALFYGGRDWDSINAEFENKKQSVAQRYAQAQMDMETLKKHKEAKEQKKVAVMVKRTQKQTNKNEISLENVESIFNELQNDFVKFNPDNYGGNGKATTARRIMNAYDNQIKELSKKLKNGRGKTDYDLEGDLMEMEGNRSKLQDKLQKLTGGERFWLDRFVNQEYINDSIDKRYSKPDQQKEPEKKITHYIEKLKKIVSQRKDDEIYKHDLAQDLRDAFSKQETSSDGDVYNSMREFNTLISEDKNNVVIDELKKYGLLPDDFVIEKNTFYPPDVQVVEAIKNHLNEKLQEWQDERNLAGFDNRNDFHSKRPIIDVFSDKWKTTTSAKEQDPYEYATKLVDKIDVPINKNGATRKSYINVLKAREELIQLVGYYKKRDNQEAIDKAIDNYKAIVDKYIALNSHTGTYPKKRKLYREID